MLIINVSKTTKPVITENSIEKTTQIAKDSFLSGREVEKIIPPQSSKQVNTQISVPASFANQAVVMIKALISSAIPGPMGLFLETLDSRITCRFCSGTGDCSYCDGSGKSWDGSGCGYCNETGKCWWCDGDGDELKPED